MKGPLMSRNACNGENGKKSPASGDLNWMPKVAPWRLAILAKMAILARIAKGLAIMAINVQVPKSPLSKGPLCHLI